MEAFAAPFCHCWRARLRPVPQAALAPLAADERARLARFHSAAAAQTYAGAHFFMRNVLARYARQPAAALILDTDLRKKSFLSSDKKLFFNLSYRAQWAVLAVSNVGEVGADVEETQPVTGAAALVEQLFSAAEQMAMQQRTGAAWWALFYDIWTRKEAWAKLLGMGLGLPFDTFSILTKSEKGTTWLVPGSGFLHSFPLDTGHTAALAVQPQSPDYFPDWQYFDYPTDSALTL